MKKMLFVSFVALSVACSGAFAETAETAEITKSRTSCQEQEKEYVASDLQFPKKLWYEPAKVCVPYRPCLNNGGNATIKYNFCHDQDYLNYTIQGINELNGIGRYLCKDQETRDGTNTAIQLNSKATKTSVTYRCGNNSYIELYATPETDAWVKLNGDSQITKNPPRFCKHIGGTWEEIGNDIYNCKNIDKKTCKYYGYYIDAINSNYKTEYTDGICQVVKK